MYWFLFLILAGQPDPNVEQCDSRAEILKEDKALASNFIQTLFAVLYEVYSSSVSTFSIIFQGLLIDGMLFILFNSDFRKK